MPTTPLVVHAPAVAQLLEPALRALADEHVDRPLALEQQLDQVATDEAGGAGDEVAHCLSSIRCVASGLTLHLPHGLSARSRSRRPRRARRQARPHRWIGGRRGPAPGLRTGSRSWPTARSSAPSARCRSRPAPAARRASCSPARFCDHAAGAGASSREDVYDTPRQRGLPGRAPGRSAAIPRIVGISRSAVPRDARPFAGVATGHGADGEVIDSKDWHDDGLVEIQMPQMGESVTEGTVLEWHKPRGSTSRRARPSSRSRPTRSTPRCPRPRAA